MDRVSRNWYWTLIYAGNLVVPLLFAAQMVTTWGAVGVALAIAAWWRATVYLLDVRDVTRHSLFTGGVALGLSQFFPMIQIIAGLTAMGLVSFMKVIDPSNDVPESLDFLGGFLMTFLTGLLLLAVALGLGFAMDWLYERYRKRSMRKPSAKPLFDPDLDR